MSNMPKLPIEKMIAGMSSVEKKMIYSAFIYRDYGSGQGQLRASKPNRVIMNFMDAAQNYVWRMLAFDFCEFKPYCCIPYSIEFDLIKGIEGNGEEWTMKKLSRIKGKLDEIIKRFESSISITEQKGIMAWLNTGGI